MKKSVVALSAVVGLSACGTLDIGDLNNPSLDDFKNNPTRAGVSSAATGLLLGHRASIAAQTGYVAELGVIGREAYIFDGADPRYVAELLGSALDPGGPAFGGNFWTGPYTNIRNAFTVQDALAKVPGMSDAEKEAVRGFSKTIQALDFLIIINTRDTNGAPIDVNRQPGGPLAPIESKEAVFAHISTLLDEAKGHLQNGGGSFPFELSEGFASETREAADGFDTPARFLKLNRALKARVSVYRGEFNEALTALSESFLDNTKPLTVGAYNVFGEGTGETESSLNSTNIYAHPSIVTDAERQQADNTLLDARVLAKVEKTDDPGSAADGKLASEWVFTMYPKAETRVPIIRNEELILLRAEANIGLGQFPAAADDINFIRVNSGRLAPVGITPANALDELLKQKRYSLLFEGGHRWIDLRRYGRLDTLPRELSPNVAPHERFPIPANEMSGRQ
ncbi:MAG TPA: RagB/SusD family nutrient uptake outer membrane protein [Myxococcus sp.]|nr:RagB/SusD family nutrient uptake outer membrane protein [Myxococcus sp.]